MYKNGIELYGSRSVVKIKYDLQCILPRSWNGPNECSYCYFHSATDRIDRIDMS